jgi:molybdate transport system substrate-binding protein
MRRLVVFLLLTLISATGGRTAERDVTVFAAASLTNALQDIGRDFEVRSGIKVKFSFGASSLLARQIEAGADADIFFSADTEWMNYVAARKLIRVESRANVLSNRLALIVPAASTVTLKIAPGFALAAALGDSRLSIADPDTVPAGKYAKAALTTLGVWDAVAGRLARAENVRAALAYVARGETGLGIVYETDAKAESKVRIVDVFAVDTHPAIVYPVALTQTANSRGANAFFAFIISDKAAAAFKRHGFSAVPQ